MSSHLHVRLLGKSTACDSLMGLAKSEVHKIYTNQKEPLYKYPSFNTQEENKLITYHTSYPIRWSRLPLQSALFQQLLEDPGENLGVLGSPQPDLAGVYDCVGHPDHVLVLGLQLQPHLHCFRSLFSHALLLTRRIWPPRTVKDSYGTAALRCDYNERHAKAGTTRDTSSAQQVGSSATLSGSRSLASRAISLSTWASFMCLACNLTQQSLRNPHHVLACLQANSLGAGLCCTGRRHR